MSVSQNGAAAMGDTVLGSGQEWGGFSWLWGAVRAARCCASQNSPTEHLHLTGHSSAGGGWGPWSSEMAPSSNVSSFAPVQWQIWNTVARESLCTPTCALHSPGKVTSPLIKGFNNICLIRVNNGPQDAARIN